MWQIYIVNTTMQVLKKGLARDLWGFQDRSHILKEEFKENTSCISDTYILNPYMQSPLSLKNCHFPVRTGEKNKSVPSKPASH